MRSAVLYETQTGLEFRVDENGTLLYSELQRPGVTVTETSALHDVYLQQGWIDMG